jgi:hypothetical protein
MRILGSVVAAVLALCAAVAPASALALPSLAVTMPAKQSTPTATFGAGPASPVVTKHHQKRIQYQLDGRPYFNYDAQAGSAKVDHLAILNFARKPQTLAVYSVDATTATNGDFTYSPQSAKRVGAGAWVAVGTPHASGVVRVPARSRVYLPIHLSVPANAAPGDHAAAVVVSLTGFVKGKSGERVKLEQRVATRVIIRVSGPLHPQLSVANVSTHFSGSLNPLTSGTTTVRYIIHNTGNTLLGGVQQVSVHGWLGSTTRAAAMPGIPLLLPGASYPVSVTIPAVYPELRMSAKVQVVPAGLQGDVNPGVRVVSATAGFWAVPWTVLLILVLLIATAAGWVWRKRTAPRRALRQRSKAEPGREPNPKGVPA